jgi:hypothetical protein
MYYGYVELARAVAWPIAILLSALIFRPSLLKAAQNLAAALPALMRRKVEVEAFGARLAVEAEQQQPEQAPPTGPNLTVAALVPSENEAVRLQEESINRGLIGVDEANKNATLIREMAKTMRFAANEWVYNRIFGSQIRFLQHLNMSGPSQYSYARGYYSTTAEMFPEFFQNFDVDKWLHFLFRNTLIEQAGEMISITVYGRDFLGHLVTQGLNPNRQG